MNLKNQNLDASAILNPASKLEAESGAEAMHRPIRSFVLRQGRYSQAQARAHQTLMPQFGIAYQPCVLDFAAAFGRIAPTVLEIGFGMGETSAHIAKLLPEKNFIGVEVHTPGVGSLLRYCQIDNLRNIRIIQHDAVEVLNQMIPDAALHGLHIFFPDPWPKLRHHKRRLIQPEFVKLLASKLVPNGYLHLATDWENYAEQMLEVLSGEAVLTNTAANYADRPAWRSESNFERKGINKGHRVRDLLFIKK
jgi:tRNA (guanine-N7-)-methyltransferase